MKGRLKQKQDAAVSSALFLIFSLGKTSTVYLYFSHEVTLDHNPLQLKLKYLTVAKLALKLLLHIVKFSLLKPESFECLAVSLFRRSKFLWLNLLFCLSTFKNLLRILECFPRLNCFRRFSLNLSF